jgi:hypothetical protein
MQGDEWHNGKYTVIPKVSEGKGLNFLDKSAEEYLGILKKYLSEKGLKPDKPIAFLCNPPYRSDEDQSAESIKYEVDPSIIDITGNDGASERYCCFLAQMQRICEQAESNGLPGESILLLFTKAAWLTDRPVFRQTRNSVLSRFESKGAFIVNGKEFFDLKGKFPVAFSIWKFSNKKLDGNRPVQITDLTWLKNKNLSEIDWDNQDEYSATTDTNILKKEKPQPTNFQWTLKRRLALASYAVNELQDDPNFGRTKLVKILYLAEYISGVDLQTNYYREAAGPLDHRTLYNEQIGIEPNAVNQQLFSVIQPSKTKVKKGIVKYIPGSNINSSIDFFTEHFGDLNQRKSVERLIDVVRPMTTVQIEIFATLFACWNDFLIKKKKPNDKKVIDEFLTNWHEGKKRFSVGRLQKALDWMKKNDFVPTGTGSPSQTKIDF